MKKQTFCFGLLLAYTYLTNVPADYIRNISVRFQFTKNANMLLLIQETQPANLRHFISRFWAVQCWYSV